MKCFLDFNSSGDVNLSIIITVLRKLSVLSTLCNTKGMWKKTGVNMDELVNTIFKKTEIHSNASIDIETRNGQNIWC